MKIILISEGKREGKVEMRPTNFVATHADGTGLFTAEQVGIGHPDKFCDKVSDTLLTKVLEKDPYAHCAIETMAKGDKVIVAGEVTTEATEVLADENISRIVNELWSFLYGNLDSGVEVINLLDKQSPEIFNKVQDGGAGDQGVMVGYATCYDEFNNHNPEYYLASNLLSIAQTQGIGVVGLDAKSQVTLNHGFLEHVVFSAQQLCDSEEEFYDAMQEIANTWADENEIPRKTLNKVLSINPGGLWTIGGPIADSGLTGRKIIADTYGPYVGHGGGAFSGKDYTKVDRSGAYLARAIAKNIVKQTYYHEVRVELAYQIGYPEPVGFSVITDNECNDALTNHIKGKVSLNPIGIAELLNLRNVDYGKYCTLGHFMHRDAPWETVEIEL